jgi:hypothetical protein
MRLGHDAIKLMWPFGGGYVMSWIGYDSEYANETNVRV